MSCHRNRCLVLASLLVVGVQAGAAETVAAETVAAETVAADSAPLEGVPRARAATDASVEAERLFEEGRRLLEARQPAQACVVLLRSQSLERAVGTLLNIGLCHKLSNRFASAWLAYGEAEKLARSQGDAERAELARLEATEVERQLGRVVVEVNAMAQPAMVIWLDGRPLPVAQWGKPLALDEGGHILRAQATGFEPWQIGLKISNGSMLTLRVPRLEALPAATNEDRAAKNPEGTPSLAGVWSGPPGRDDSPWTTRQYTAAGLGSAGLLALGAGGYFALAALDNKSKATGECRPSGVCTERGIQLRDEAGDKAGYATALGSLGMGALVGAGILWFTQPQRPGPVLRVGLELEQRRFGLGLGGVL